MFFGHKPALAKKLPIEEAAKEIYSANHTRKRKMPYPRFLGKHNCFHGSRRGVFHSIRFMNVWSVNATAYK